MVCSSEVSYLVYFARKYLCAFPSVANEIFEGLLGIMPVKESRKSNVLLLLLLNFVCGK